MRAHASLFQGTIPLVIAVENADAIEAAHLGGWTVVTKKGEFKAGDPVLYFEIDSFLPGSVPEFEFLLARGTKNVTSPITNETVAGHVCRLVHSELYG